MISFPFVFLRSVLPSVPRRSDFIRLQVKCASCRLEMSDGWPPREIGIMWSTVADIGSGNLSLKSIGCPQIAQIFCDCMIRFLFFSRAVRCSPILSALMFAIMFDPPEEGVGLKTYPPYYFYNIDFLLRCRPVFVDNLCQIPVKLAAVEIESFFPARNISGLHVCPGEIRSGNMMVDPPLHCVCCFSKLLTQRRQDERIRFFCSTERAKLFVLFLRQPVLIHLSFIISHGLISPNGL